MDATAICDELDFLFEVAIEDDDEDPQADAMTQDAREDREYWG